MRRIDTAFYVHRCRRETGRTDERAFRRNTERHPQGIHCRDIHIPSQAVDAPDHRHFEFCSNNIPKWNTISISGYHIREAGSTAIQEVAFTLADGIAYIGPRSNPDRIRTCSANVSLSSSTPTTISSKRSPSSVRRKIWAKIMKERFRSEGQERPDASLPYADSRMHAYCPAGREQHRPRRYPDDGGGLRRHPVATPTVLTKLALPTDKSVRIALRTQQIVAYESGITNTVDPLAGSYVVEALTKQIEDGAWEYINKIDEMGGMLTAIEKGYPQKQIQDAAYQYQKSIESETASLSESISSR